MFTFTCNFYPIIATVYLCFVEYEWMTVLESWVLTKASESRYFLRLCTKFTGVMSLPTLTRGSWSWRRVDAEQRTSVMEAFSWSRFEHIHVATSSMHADCSSYRSHRLYLRVIGVQMWIRCRPWPMRSRSTSAVFSTSGTGPRTEPCGTPLRSSMRSDTDLPQRTYGVRPSRYEVNQPRTSPDAAVGSHDRPWRTLPTGGAERRRHQCSVLVAYRPEPR